MAKELVGWKEIADRLGVTVRAAQRYAAFEEDPLPCYRRLRTVCLDVAELEAWRERHRAPLRPTSVPAPTETLLVDARLAPLVREFERTAVRFLAHLESDAAAPKGDR